MVRTRLGGAAATLALIAAACSTTTPATVPSHGATPPARTGDPAGSPPTSPSMDPTAGTTFQTRPPSTIRGTEPPASPFVDHGGVGAMATTFLSGRAARSMVVEIDRVQGTSIPRTAQGHLRAVMTRDLVKPDGIAFDEGGVLPAGGDDDGYTWAELHAIAAAARDTDSGGSTAVLHVLVLDGFAQQARGAIGAAIDATTIVFFADLIESSADLFVSATAIWRSVLVHELGHILGLVEIVEPSKTGRHEDPEHKGHSPNQGSVMYWAVESSSIASILSGGPPDDFDADDRADLASLRSR